MTEPDQIADPVMQAAQTIVYDKSMDTFVLVALLVQSGLVASEDFDRMRTTLVPVFYRILAEEADGPTAQRHLSDFLVSIAPQRNLQQAE